MQPEGHIWLAKRFYLVWGESLNPAYLRCRGNPGHGAYGKTQLAQQLDSASQLLSAAIPSVTTMRPSPAVWARRAIYPAPTTGGAGWSRQVGSLWRTGLGPPQAGCAWPGRWDGMGPWVGRWEAEPGSRKGGPDLGPLL